MSLLSVPEELKACANWVVWKYETRKGKVTKPPYDANQNGNHVHAETDNTATWASFSRAMEVTDIFSGNDYEGAGFVFTGTDYVGIDLDGVVHDDGIIDPFAVEIMKLANSYCEFSPSETGVHVIFESSLPLPEGNRKGNKKLGGEIYNKTSPRYFTVTGNKIDGLSTDAIAKIDDSDKIGLLHFMVLHLHDTKLTSLWMGDPSLWGPTAKYPSQSEADEALCGLLARILNYDAPQIEQYFSASMLGQRAKWTTRPDYRKRTIEKALSGAASGNSPPVGASGPNNGEDWKLDLVPLSDIEAEIQEWLWENRIPKDALTNVSGDADKGKSLTLYDILARISKGADFPDGAKNPFGGRPRKVLLMFSEGSLKTTVKPRMMVMGANMGNIITIKSVSRKGEKDANKRQFCLETDLGVLRKALQNNPDIVAIGFDPITNYLGDECNMNRSQDVRRVLTPLGELAEEYGVTVISIIHFSKNTAMSAMHRTGGAAALVEVPRAAWCCTDDDDPENKGGFVFVRIKNNLGKRVGGLCYRIEETFINIKGKQSSQPRLVWGKATEKDADDLLSLQNDPEMKGVAKARHWLEETFKDGLGRKSTWMYSAALSKGITEDCVKKARAALRMESKKLDLQWYLRTRQGGSVPWGLASDPDDEQAGNNGADDDAKYTEQMGGIQRDFEIQ